LSATGVKIAAVGRYAPERIVTNADFEKTLETSDEWIVSRTGMKRRHYAAPDQATSDLAIAAARDALSRTNLTAQDVDCYIVATATPDYPFPATACIVPPRSARPTSRRSTSRSPAAGSSTALPSVRAWSVRASIAGSC